ncbi:hypothetical protein [Pseudomonas mosselii]|uniref:hypothetical protein n=1 Tax=Pseudomonas mosselii TaxID=78327 RepID=UPI002161CE51|nr:hypothetical protein [Pseudomonas mosselii]UVN43326.1 hypothetical protein NW905_19735 [Pseudomonas mosselii]
MAVTPSEFIAEAQRLLDQDVASEITHRTAVGRAYYGAYHCALNYADTLLVPPLSACAGGSHKKVSDYYRVGLAKTREDTVKFRKIGFNLLQMHAQRVRADYRLDEVVHVQDAESILQISRATVDSLETLGAAV